ncbi:helix-turn-helix domain-containing protein [Flavobacteriaceae bacterium MHTCC 0001]
MLKTIQVIALTQGIFLLFILFKKRSNYKKTTFWLFVGSIVSILLFLVGDDDNNLFLEETDWFIFDSSLFITFLLLFFKYYKTKDEQFNKKDLWFFLPNAMYFITESIEVLKYGETIVTEVFEKVVELTFLGYLFFIIIDLFRTKSRYWILYLTIPIALHMSVNYLNEILELMGFQEIIISNHHQYQSYFLLIIAFLFYGITFFLINRPKELLPIAKSSKYKGSNLNQEQVNAYTLALIDVMQNKKMYKNPKLSIHKLSQELNVPRQYISEVLNVHIGKNFQDFVNDYRVEAFVELLEKDRSDQFTLVGLANQVGFNSKSTFNTVFKKNKGLTPSEFKKTLL